MRVETLFRVKDVINITIHEPRFISIQKQMIENT